MSLAEKEFNQLLRKYEGYIYKIIKKYPFEHREDLYQVGALAIYQGIQTHDATKASFSTYIYNQIRGAVGHYFRDNCQTIRVPRWLHEKGITVETVSLEQRHLDTVCCIPNIDNVLDAKHILDNMTNEERIILVMHYIHGDSYRIVAQRISKLAAKSAEVMTSRKARQAIERYKRKFGHTQDSLMSS